MEPNIKIHDFGKMFVKGLFLMVAANFEANFPLTRIFRRGVTKQSNCGRFNVGRTYHVILIELLW